MGRNGGVISFYLLASQHMLIGELHIPGRGATRWSCNSPFLGQLYFIIIISNAKLISYFT